MGRLVAVGAVAFSILLVAFVTPSGAAGGPAFATIYTEQIADGPLQQVTVKAARGRIDDEVVLRVEVLERTPGRMGPADKVVVSVNGVGNGWQRVVLEPEDEPGLWGGFLGLRARGEGLLVVQLKSPREDRRQSIGTRTAGARVVNFDPFVDPVHLPATSPAAPFVIFAQAFDDPLVEHVQVGLFVADPLGVGASFRVELSQPMDEAEVVVDWNPSASSWQQFTLEQVGERTYIADLLPVVRGEALFSVRVQQSGQWLALVGSRAEPLPLALRFARPEPVELAEDAPMEDPEFPGYSVVYVEQVDAGPIAELVVRAAPDGSGVRAMLDVRLRERERPLPPHRVVAAVNGKGMAWGDLLLHQESADLWRGERSIPVRGKGYLIVSLEQEDGPDLQVLGTEVAGARAVFFDPEAGRVEVRESGEPPWLE